VKKRKIKLDKCQLCGKGDKKEKLEYYCGGYLWCAHSSCAKIGNRAIEQYAKRQLLHWKVDRKYTLKWKRRAEK